MPNDRATEPSAEAIEAANHALKLFSHDYDFKAGVIHVAYAFDAFVVQAVQRERDRLTSTQFIDALGRHLYVDWDALNDNQRDIRCGRILRIAMEMLP